ncbi:MAG: phosphoribosylglycinamide formyltransferase [Bacteroidales bacterium]|jgi:phosphoribosylglycinamide formyltransferase 1
MHHIAIFASGSGSNAQQITEYFRSHPDIRVRLILSNNPDAYVLKRADNMGIPSYLFNREELYNSKTVLKVLQDHEISFIVLAGFLWLVPDYLLKAYSGRIVNIHPALLPKFGGKGMYGEKVHEAVIQSGEKRTGISIHFVNERYDEGEIIFQESFEIKPDDTPESIAERVHSLEYRHFPEVIESVINNC